MLKNINFIIEAIPVIAILGVLVGFGAYQTVFGAFIAGLIFLIFAPKSNYVLVTSVVYTVALAGFNVYLGGKSTSLLSLIFLSSLIVLLFSPVKPYLFRRFLPQKNLISAFLAGIFTSAVFLCVPMFFGMQTFSSFNLMLSSGFTFFNEVSETALVCTLFTLALYYYLSKIRVNWLPRGVLAILAACAINFIYKMNLPNLSCGLQNFPALPEGNFGHFPLLLFFSFLLACIIIYQTIFYTRLGCNKNKLGKALFLSGFSGIFAAFTGLIPAFINKTACEKKYLNLLSVLIFGAFAVLFIKFSHLVPLCAAASIFALKCFSAAKYFFKKTKFKKLPLFCFILTFYNLALSLALIICIKILFYIKSFQKKRI